MAKTEFQTLSGDFFNYLKRDVSDLFKDLEKMQDTLITNTKYKSGGGNADSEEYKTLENIFDEFQDTFKKFKDFVDDKLIKGIPELLKK